MTQNEENTIDTEFASLTKIGKMFGVSSQKVGCWLADLGHRVIGGDPTEKARSLGFTKKVPTGRGDGDRQFYIWHISKTVKLLEGTGHQQTGVPYQQPVVISRNPLAGPFSYRSSGDSDFWELVNGDGHVFAWEIGDESVPKITVQLLNLADKHGKLPLPME
jgi:hypothetical protein